MPKCVRRNLKSLLCKGSNPFFCLTFDIKIERNYTVCYLVEQETLSQLLIYEHYPESLPFSMFVESKIKSPNGDSLQALTFGN